MLQKSAARRSARNSHEWIQFFEEHVSTEGDFPWFEMIRLSPEERARVLPSIAIFQLGESGEGRHLFCAAQEWAGRSGDRAYVVALKLFIGEEHRHAGMLGRYLDLAGYSRLEHNWTDGLFRWFRHLAGLELSITVLLSAELVAMVYYAALRRASGCPLLASICRQILADECGHIRFQSQQLGRLRAEHHPMIGRALAWFHAGLLLVISVGVWWTHQPVLRAAGWNYFQFANKLWGQFRAARTIMQSMREAGAAVVEPPPPRLCISS